MKRFIAVLAIALALAMPATVQATAYTASASGRMLEEGSGAYSFWMVLSKLKTASTTSYCPGADAVSEASWNFDCTFPGLSCSRFTFVTDDAAGITFTRNSEAFEADSVITYVAKTYCSRPQWTGTLTETIVVLDTRATWAAANIATWLAGTENYLTIYVGRVVIGGGTLHISTAACSAPEPRCGAVYFYANDTGSDTYEWRGETVKVYDYPGPIWQTKQREVRD